MSSIRIVKRKARGFFKSEDALAIKDAIESVHRIMTNATILVRAFYLEWFQENHPLENENDYLEIDETLFSVACRIVQGDTKPAIRGTKKESKSDLFNRMFQVYKRLYDRLPQVKNCSPNVSLSHVLAYAVQGIVTAYENNVHAHFPKYSKRYVLCDLVSKGVEVKEARKQAAVITNYFLYDTPLEEGLDASEYSFLFPAKMTVKQLPRCWDLKVHPWAYLYKMVQINQDLETDFQLVNTKHKRLLNPLPFHSSFVPMHIRLDTSGLCQLLMNQQRIKEFKDLYELEHGVSLNMKTKGDMLSSFEKLFGRPPSSKEEGGLFATDLWAFLTNLKLCKQWKELNGLSYHDKTWRFDNAVVTDGVSISFQIIESEAFGRKVLSGRKKKSINIEESECKEDIKTLELDKYKCLGCDPGKSDILTITDGIKTIRYTRGQRDQDTYKGARNKETLQRKRKNGLEVYETQVLNQYSKKSCHLDIFKRYACLRKQKEEEFLGTYGHPVFRQFKFTFHCQTKASEHRFVNTVMRTFSPSRQHQKRCMTDVMISNASKNADTRNDIVIGWGNWGKAPNVLKGSAPTPGIGIRRRFESFFKTVTVDEHMTSQTCPCCNRGKCLKKTKIGNNATEERHHLLRCTNDACESRWWNRNVVGSFNILKRFLQPPSNETTGVGLRRRHSPKART